MKAIWFVISLCLLFYGIHAAHQLYEGDICDRDGSKCQHVKNCPNIKKQIESNKRPTLCGFNGTDVVVCCQPDVPWNSDEYYKSISHSICHVYEEELCKNKSIGSSNTLKNLESKLPFMAMVGYGTRSSITWNCGGTLISREYVLSAAHCTKHNLLGSAGWVRLKNEDPNDRESTYRIVFKINHPDYQPPMQYNDVALYRLNRIVRFGELVKPLCLPNLDYMDYTRDFNVIGAGWIRNKGSIRAASGLLSVVPSGRCSFVGNKYEIPDGTNKESIICTTSLSDGNNDCSNHFGGGSLFISDNTEKQTKSCYMGVLMGVLSIGRLCDGHNFPGAYTNVSYFLPWINSVVWPENSTHTQLIWA